MDGSDVDAATASGAPARGAAVVRPFDELSAGEAPPLADCSDCVPGTTLEEPKPFSECSADVVVVVAADVVDPPPCPPVDPDCVPEPRVASDPGVRLDDGRLDTGVLGAASARASSSGSL